MTRADIQGMSKTELMEIIHTIYAEILHKEAPHGEEPCGVFYISLVMRNIPNGHGGTRTSFNILQSWPTNEHFEAYTKKEFKKGFDHVSMCLQESIAEGTPFIDYMKSLVSYT